MIESPGYYMMIGNQQKPKPCYDEAMTPKYDVPLFAPWTGPNKTAIISRKQTHHEQ